MKVHDIYQPNLLNGCSHPVVPPVAAGFPSPADDFLEKRLDLNDYLISNPVATFFMRVKGSSMREAGILDGDVLVVDRSRKAKNGDIIITLLDGEMTVKRLQYWKSGWYLLSDNAESIPITVTEDQPLYVWGVALHAIHTF